MVHGTLDEHELDGGSSDVREFCRGINERIVEYAAPSETVNLICECPHPGCFVNIRMPVPEFRLILGGTLAYVVAPGHVDDASIVRHEVSYDVVLAPELPRTPLDDLFDRLHASHEAPLQHPPVG